MKKIIKIPIILTIIVFVIKFVIDYKDLVLRQPIFLDGKIIGPVDFTSFPPSYALITALIYAIPTFVISLIVYFIIYHFVLINKNKSVDIKI